MVQTTSIQVTLAKASLDDNIRVEYLKKTGPNKDGHDYFEYTFGVSIQ